MTLYGAIEAGGTKFVCGIGSGYEDLKTVSIPTADPASTMQEVIAFLRGAGGGKLAGVGIGSFGPICADPASPSWGHIGSTTPKSEWRDYNLAGTIQTALSVPVGFDTDVNAAALGEARWGASRGVADSLYLTVGTGIGGGAIASGQIVHGAGHPEMGHIRIPHDMTADPYKGCCPYHGDCLEGLASGPAIEERWGARAEELPADHPAWVLEAQYLAAGIVNLVCTLAPTCVILGGGVMHQSVLFPMIREEAERLTNGYIRLPDIVPPTLGDRAGVAGALILAEQAVTSPRSPARKSS